MQGIFLQLTGWLISIFLGRAAEAAPLNDIETVQLNYLGLSGTGLRLDFSSRDADLHILIGYFLHGRCFAPLLFIRVLAQLHPRLIRGCRTSTGPLLLRANRLFQLCRESLVLRKKL